MVRTFDELIEQEDSRCIWFGGGPLPPSPSPSPSPCCCCGGGGGDSLDPSAAGAGDEPGVSLAGLAPAPRPCWLPILAVGSCWDGGSESACSSQAMGRVVRWRMARFTRSRRPKPKALSPPRPAGAVCMHGHAAQRQQAGPGARPCRSIAGVLGFQSMSRGSAIDCNLIRLDVAQGRSC